MLAAERVDLTGEAADFLTRVRYLLSQRLDLLRKRLLLLDQRRFGAGRQFQLVFNRRAARCDGVGRTRDALDLLLELHLRGRLPLDVLARRELLLLDLTKVHPR